ncbi:hypothetical protein [Nocardioides sp.]|uniref:hypothetical protein n=1 Tax=Nocardioides sp. TaxID=35761 RepID=UPI0019869137|nr:hypothetical protein [Nocardioides sp.]MBC7279211.1 hypothetical protein [Nocardioides sp.]
MSTPTLHIDTAHDVAVALGRALIAQGSNTPDLGALIVASQETPGRAWIARAAEEAGNFWDYPIDSRTARLVLASLCDDLRDRQVPEELIQARFTLELEDSATSEELNIIEWLAAAGDAWQAALADDAQADAGDDAEDLVPAEITAELERARDVRDAFYSHFPKQS